MVKWRHQNDRYFLSGRLDRHEVPAFWDGRQSWMPKEASIVVDLSELSRVDSAGMAMLIHLAMHYNSQGWSCQMANPPGQLMTLLRLSHAEGLLPIAK